MPIESQTQATIFIVDDDADARLGLQRLLTSCGYRTEVFPSARAFLERLPIEGDGCLILDHQMPEMTGMDLLEELAGTECKIPIVFLTAHGDIPTSVKAIKWGAEDFLPKLADEEALLDAVERAVQRSRDVLADQRENQQIIDCAATLTEREREVCQHVIAGRLNKQIAGKLGITERTVKAHRAKVMQKFNVVSIADLVRLAEQAGIQPAIIDD